MQNPIVVQKLHATEKLMHKILVVRIRQGLTRLDNAVKICVHQLHYDV